jgi:hypothetical protein
VSAITARQAPKQEPASMFGELAIAWAACLPVVLLLIQLEDWGRK